MKFSPPFYDRHYIWGYVQGGSMLLVGLFLLVTSFLVDEHGFGMFVYGAWWAIAGVLLILRSIYGVIVLYMALADTVFSVLRGGLSRNPLWEIAALVFLGLPGLAYYTLIDEGIWLEMGSARTRREAGPPPKPTPLPPTMLVNTSDEDVQQILRDISERRKARETGQK